MKNRFLARQILLGGVGFFFAVMGLQAQEKAFTLHADYATFLYQSDRLNCELYYSVYHSKPEYERINENQYRWMGALELTIVQGEKVVVSDKWQTQGTVADLSDGIPPVYIIDRVPYILPIGEYDVRIKVRDIRQPSYQDSVSFHMSLLGLPKEKVAFSDIQFASNIQRGVTDKSNPFYKNTLIVIPNPNRVYGQGVRFLHFYAEVYNLGLLPENAPYTFSYKVKDANNVLVPGIPPVRVNRTRKVDATVEVGTVRVDSLASGVYNLQFAIEDEKGDVIQNKEAQFYIYNPDIQYRATLTGLDLEQLFAISEFYEMPSDMVEGEMEYVEIIGTPAEKSVAKQLDNDEAKKLWLFK